MSSVIYFWSPTCEPCKALKLVIEDLKEDFPNVQWYSVNIKDDPTNQKEKYGVSQVPTVVAISKDGTITTQSGRDSIGYYRLLRSLIDYS